MENTSKTTPELEQIFEEYPKLMQFSGRYRSIQSFIDNGKRETDLAIVRDDYETALKLQEKLYAELITFYIQEHSKNFEDVLKISNDLKKQNEQLAETINIERKNSKELFENLCFALLINPVDGFQVLLNHIEREEKKEDLTGKGWLWSFSFSFRARVRMAWKLIFGTKEAI